MSFNDRGGSEQNIAFIDGQNLHLGTSKNIDNPWTVDLHRFRIYLLNKYKVSKAYYFLGYINDECSHLYNEIQEAGFVLIFKQHTAVMSGLKKGNVDTDIVFHVLKRLLKKDDFEKIVLVSGDGNYKILVDFLVEEKRLKKILFPNKRYASSLYKKLGTTYFDYLDQTDIRKKFKKRKGLLR